MLVDDDFDEPNFNCDFPECERPYVGPCTDENNPCKDSAKEARCFCELHIEHSIHAATLPKEKKTREKRSFVWKHMTHNLIADSVECNVWEGVRRCGCKISFKSGGRNGTSNLKRHLSEMHKITASSGESNRTEFEGSNKRTKTVFATPSSVSSTSSIV